MSSKSKKKQLSTQEEAEAKKKRKEADETFKKRVTIINGFILLAFIIGIGCFIYFSWYGNASYQKKFEAEKASAKEAALVKDSDDSVIDIELTDKNFYDWIMEIDSTYLSDKAENYRCYDGNTIHLQGIIKKHEFANGGYEYWVCRYYAVDGETVDSHTHSDSTTHDATHHELNIMVEFEGEAPADGTWVDVVGTLSKANYNLSCIKNAKLTVMDEPGNELVD